MKTLTKLLIGGLVAAVMPVAANAAVTVYGNTAYGLAAPVGPTVLSTITFDEAAPTYTITANAGSAGRVNGSVANTYAAPAASATTFDTTNYLATYSTNGAFPAISTLSGFGTYQYVSLYWGSVDSYNQIDFGNLVGGVFTSIGSLTGLQIGPPANGDQDSAATNRRITLDAGGTFNAIRFTTGANAFEVDNISFLSSVPEPASWAMMVGGFGLMGAAMRRKKSAALFA